MDAPNTSSATSTTTTAFEEPSALHYFNRGGVKTLLEAHMHIVDYVSRLANVYYPAIYAPPKGTMKPTEAEKAALAKTIKREKKTYCDDYQVGVRIEWFE